MKRSYESHMFKSQHDLMLEFQKDGGTKDRKNMGKMMKPALNYLDQNGITKQQNFYQNLHTFGLKANDINEMIYEFKDSINSYMQKLNYDEKIIIDWIKKRELKKSNFCEKNIVMNRLAAEYPQEFIVFINNYLLRKYPCKSDVGILVDEISIKIHKLTQQKQINSFLKFFK